MCFRSSFLVGNEIELSATRKPRLIFRCCLLSAVFAGGSGSVVRADVPAQDILKKMAAVYDVKSFQGMVTVNQTGTTEENKPFNLSSTEEITYKRPNLFYIKNSGPGVGGTQITAFNGKETINYTSSQNQYMKTSVPPTAAGKADLSLLSLFGVRIDVMSGKVVNSTILAGKAAYVVQALPPVPALPPDAPAAARTQLEQLKKMLIPYELAIDKKDFHLLRVTQTTPAIKLTKTLVITQQTLNPNEADSAFDFTPPPGAKLVARRSPDTRGLNVSGFSGKPVGTAARVSQGNGSPVPPPHASPGANGTPHKP